MARIFISYSRADTMFVETVVPILNDVYANQHTIWYDSHIVGGEDWWARILREIDACDLFIYLISDQSLESSYCQAECREALRLHKPVLPVIVRRSDIANAPDDLEPTLRRLNWIDLSRGFNDPKKNAKLYQAINTTLYNAPDDTPPPRYPQPVPEPVVADKPAGSRERDRRGWLVGAVAALVLLIGAAVFVPWIMRGDDDPTPTAPTEAVIVATDEPTATATDEPTATTSAEDFLDQGNDLQSTGDHAAAVEAFTQAIDLDPTEAEYFLERGFSFQNLQQYNQAIANYDEAIRLDSEYILAYTNRGWANHLIGEYERAIEDYDEAIRLDPEDAWAYNNRGNAYNALENHERAIEDYDEAIRLDPEYARAYNNRGWAYNALRDYERAIADLDEAIRLDPEDARAYNNRGFAYRRLGEYERAIEDYDEAIRLDPENANAYANRGFAHEQRGDCNAAIADYERALAIDPNYETAQNNLERVRNECG